MNADGLLSILPELKAQILARPLRLTRGLWVLSERPFCSNLS